jgi:hypothetical protein
MRTVPVRAIPFAWIIRNRVSLTVSSATTMAGTLGVPLRRSGPRARYAEDAVKGARLQSGIAFARCNENAAGDEGLRTRWLLGIGTRSALNATTPAAAMSRAHARARAATTG